MTRPLRVGIAGLGTVGASVIRILDRQNEAVAQRGGRPVEVVAVSARDRTKDRGVDLSRFTWFDDPVDDVGEGVVFLCGPQSRYVTGTTLMLDGGRSYLR